MAIASSLGNAKLSFFPAAEAQFEKKETDEEELKLDTIDEVTEDATLHEKEKKATSRFKPPVVAPKNAI